MSRYKIHKLLDGNYLTKLVYTVFIATCLLTEIIKLTTRNFALIFDFTPKVALLQQTDLYFVLPDVTVQERL